MTGPAFRVVYALLALGIGVPTLLLAVASLPAGLVLGPASLVKGVTRLAAGHFDGESWFFAVYFIGAYAGMAAWCPLSWRYLRDRSAFLAAPARYWAMLAGGALAALTLWYAAPYRSGSLWFCGPGMLLPMVYLALARLAMRPAVPPPLPGVGPDPI